MDLFSIYVSLLSCTPTNLTRSIASQLGRRVCRECDYAAQPHLAALLRTLESGLAENLPLGALELSALQVCEIVCAVCVCACVHTRRIHTCVRVIAGMPM